MKDLLVISGSCIRQIWHLLSNAQRLSLITASASMALAAWFNAHIPIYLGSLATRMTQAKSTGAPFGVAEAKPFLFTLALFFLCREGIHVIRKFLVHRTTTQLEKDTSVKLIKHLLQLDLVSLSHEQVGSRQEKIRRSVEGLIRMLMLSFMDLLPAIFTAGFAIGVAIQRNPPLGLLMTAVVPVLLVIVSRQIISQIGIRVELLGRKLGMNGMVVEQLASVEYVRAANTLDQEVRRVEHVANAVRLKEMRHHVAMAWYDCGKACTEGLFFLLTVAAAITMVARGTINPGEVLTVAMLYASIIGPMHEVHRIVDEAAENSVKVKDLISILSEPRDRSFSSVANRIPIPSAATPVISCCNLNLHYPANGRPAIPVLRDVTANILPGQLIGIAGPTGCGKSTWIKTFLRLRHPTSGLLNLCGIPIEEISRDGIANLLSYVGQNPFNFTGTIAENIAYGSEHVSCDAIQKAAKAAHIHEEIMSKPDNYYTQITERGQSLSGGQLQRIAIARALLQAKPVLILDEATSALDNLSESAVLRSLSLSKPRPTILMIAHRLSTLRNADRILVFSHGQIVEEGAYDALVQAGGLFSQMVVSGDHHNAA
jgi:ATP-binding cassette subfamily B protein